MNSDKQMLDELNKIIAGGLDPALVFKALELLRSHRPTPFAQRRLWQDALMLDHLPKNCSVLDLGCGDGELLVKLIKTLKVRGQGVELNPQAVMKAIDRGVPVLNLDLDEGLIDFADRSFDYVILESTLQTLKSPLKVLREMLRVGRRGIVSFPNFGYWRVRLDLAARGRMPVTSDLPYGWHDTPNIHLFTLADFIDWCRKASVQITLGFCLSEGQVRPLGDGDNLTAEEVLLFLELV